MEGKLRDEGERNTKFQTLLACILPSALHMGRVGQVTAFSMLCRLETRLLLYHPDKTHTS